MWINVYKRGNYVVTVGVKPGVYSSWEAALNQVKGVTGGFFKRFSSQQQAQNYYMEALTRGEVRGQPTRRSAHRRHEKQDSEAPSTQLAQHPEIRQHPPQTLKESALKAVHPAAGQGAVFRAYTDGSLKGPLGSASAVLAQDGMTVGRSTLAMPLMQDNGEVEVRAILLALLMAPRGSLIQIHTDRQDLAEQWQNNEKDAWGLFEVARHLQQVLRLNVEVIKVPRTTIQDAHNSASQAHLERKRKEEESQRVKQFLERLPVRHRMAAVKLMEKYLHRYGHHQADGFITWLKEGTSETRRLLLEALNEGVRLGTRQKPHTSVQFVFPGFCSKEKLA